MVRVLAHATGLPLPEARERLRQEHRKLGANVRRAMRERNLQPHVWSEDLIRFYADTDAFLFESVTWSRSPAKCAMRQWIGDWLLRNGPPPLRILVFGDGPGFDSLYLSSAGHSVDYYDPSAAGARFAKRLFQEAARPPRILTKCECECENENSYDAVLCLDVLEHVPDPPATVRMLAARLSPGGYLIIHAPFFATTADCPTHLSSNIRYCGDIKTLYTPADLVPIAGRTLWDPIVLQRPSHATPRNSPYTRLRLNAGRFALASARVFSAPHVCAAKYIALASQRHLSKLL